MFNHVKFPHIVICVSNPCNHSLIFIFLWLSENVTKPPFIFEDDLLNRYSTVIQVAQIAFTYLLQF